MRTPKQIEASARNGAQSTGPVTKEGKSISARNSQRHNLLAKTGVLIGESKESFIDMMEKLVADYRPETESEMGLVETMGHAKWRQMRAWSVEKALLEKEMTRQRGGDGPTRLAKSMETNGSRMAAIHRYETSYGRQFDRALRQLQALQARRREREDRDGGTENEITQASATWEPGPFPTKTQA